MLYLQDTADGHVGRDSAAATNVNIGNSALVNVRRAKKTTGEGMREMCLTHPAHTRCARMSRAHHCLARTIETSVLRRKTCRRTVLYRRPPQTVHERISGFADCIEYQRLTKQPVLRHSVRAYCSTETGSEERRCNGGLAVQQFMWAAHRARRKCVNSILKMNY